MKDELTKRDIFYIAVIILMVIEAFFCLGGKDIFF